MKTRWSILLAALLGASCSTNNKNSALVITKVVLGTATTNPGPPPVTTCAYDVGSVEFSFAQINPAANSGGTMGVVVSNNLLDTSTINGVLRTNSATFHPHQAVDVSRSVLESLDFAAGATLVVTDTAILAHLNQFLDQALQVE